MKGGELMVIEDAEEEVCAVIRERCIDERRYAQSERDEAKEDRYRTVKGFGTHQGINNRWASCLEWH